MGTNDRQQKSKCLSKPKDYTAFRKKTGGNFGLAGNPRAMSYLATIPTNHAPLGVLSTTGKCLNLRRFISIAIKETVASGFT